MEKGRRAFREWVEKHPYDGYSQYYYKKFYRLRSFAEVFAVYLAIIVGLCGAIYFDLSGFVIFLLFGAVLAIGFYVGIWICTIRAKKLKKEIEGDSVGQNILDALEKLDPEAAQIYRVYAWEDKKR